MKKTGIILTILCILLCGMVVFAEEEVRVQASLDVSDYCVDIHAEGLPAFSRAVLMAVLQGESAEDSLNSGRPAYVEQIVAGANGKIDRHVAFADGTKSGMYVIHVIIGEIGEVGNDYQSVPFRYLVGSQTKETLERLNRADKKGMKDALKGCDESIALDMTEYNNELSSAEQEKTAEMLHTMRPAAGFSEIKEVHDAFGACVASVALPNAKEPLKLLEKYAQNLGIDYSLLGQCTADEQKAAAAFLQKKTDLTPEILKKIFPESVFVGKVQCAETSGDMKRYFLTDYEKELDLDLTKYQTLIYPNRVFSALYQLKNSISGYEDAREKFAVEVNKQAKAEKNQDTGSGGSHGGTGGGGGGGGNAGGGQSSGYPASSSNSGNNSENPSPAAVYSDLKDAEWATEAVLLLTNRGIVSGDGDGKFRPNSYVTRAEFLKMLLLALDVAQGGGEIAFDDVRDGDWYAPYVAAGVEKGIVKGLSEKRFGAEETITREDLTVMSLRAALAVNMHFESSVGTEPKDAELISDYARDAVRCFYGAGIVNGDTDGTFRPQSGATRAEAAKIIAGLLHQKEAMN